MYNCMVGGCTLVLKSVVLAATLSEQCKVDKIWTIIGVKGPALKHHLIDRVGAALGLW